MPYRVRDLKLAPAGRMQIEWAESRMPVLMTLRRQYSRTKPLKDVRIGGCLHVTKETAVLVRTFKAAGAASVWCGCNPLSTQDEVAAALAEERADVYAWRGMRMREYYWCIDKVVGSSPSITLDDGGDMTVRIHDEKTDFLRGVVGGTEETTTGVQRLRALQRQGRLKYPIIAVNDAETKWDFDNVYGTGQSSLDGIIRSTNILLAGKNFVVAGYGHCGRGIASRAHGLGANVTICEVDPVRSLKAVMDGFKVARMRDAAREGDVFITATGCRDVITAGQMKLMKDGAILCNAGHFNVEVSVRDLKRLARRIRRISSTNTEYTLRDGRRLYLLADGRLVNLVAAEGHPPEVMDMSFANQFLSILYLKEHANELEPEIYQVSREQDERVARVKLETLGIKIDRLTSSQRGYLEGFEVGT